MLLNLFRNRSKQSRRLSSFVVAVMALMLTTSSVSANGSCFQVNGHYDEHAVGPGQFVGTFRGVIKGDFSTTAIAPFPLLPPVNDVAHFNANTVLHAKVHGKQGDLIIANSGTVQLTGEGNIVDLQLITGGTDELAGASGAIRASGLFDPNTGEGSSDYEGTVCLP